MCTASLKLIEAWERSSSSGIVDVVVQQGSERLLLAGCGALHASFVVATAASEDDDKDAGGGDCEVELFNGASRGDEVDDVTSLPASPAFIGTHSSTCIAEPLGYSTSLRYVIT